MAEVAVVVHKDLGLRALVNVVGDLDLAGDDLAQQRDVIVAGEALTPLRRAREANVVLRRIRGGNAEQLRLAHELVRKQLVELGRYGTSELLDRGGHGHALAELRRLIGIHADQLAAAGLRCRRRGPTDPAAAGEDDLHAVFVPAGHVVLHGLARIELVAVSVVHGDLFGAAERLCRRVRALHEAAAVAHHARHRHAAEEGELVAAHRDRRPAGEEARLLLLIRGSVDVFGDLIILVLRGLPEVVLGDVEQDEEAFGILRREPHGDVRERIAGQQQDAGAVVERLAHRKLDRVIGSVLGDVGLELHLVLLAPRLAGVVDLLNEAAVLGLTAVGDERKVVFGDVAAPDRDAVMPDRLAVFIGLIEHQPVGARVGHPERVGFAVVTFDLDVGDRVGVLLEPQRPGDFKILAVLRHAVLPEDVLRALIGEDVLRRDVARQRERLAHRLPELDLDRLCLGAAEFPVALVVRAPEDVDFDRVFGLGRKDERAAVEGEAALHRRVRQSAVLHDHTVEVPAVRLPVAHPDRRAVALPCGQRVLGILPAAEVGDADRGIEREVDLADLHIAALVLIAEAGNAVAVVRAVVRRGCVDADEDAALGLPVVDRHRVVTVLGKVEVELVPRLGPAVVVGLIQRQGVGVLSVRPELDPVAVDADVDHAHFVLLVPAEGQLLGLHRHAHAEAALLPMHVGLRDALGRQDLTLAPPVDADEHRLVLGAAEAGEVVIRLVPIDLQLDVVAGLRREGEDVVLERVALLPAERGHGAVCHDGLHSFPVVGYDARADEDRAVFDLPRVDELELAVVPGVPVDRSGLVEQQADRVDLPVLDEGRPVVDVAEQVGIRVRCGHRVVQRPEDAAHALIVVRDDRAAVVVGIGEVEDHAVEGAGLAVPGLIQRQGEAVALGPAVDAPAAVGIAHVDVLHQILVVPGEGHALLRDRHADHKAAVLQDIVLLRHVRDRDLALAPPVGLDHDGLFLGAVEPAVFIGRHVPVDLNAELRQILRREAQNVVLEAEALLHRLPVFHDRSVKPAVRGSVVRGDADAAIGDVHRIHEADLAVAIVEVPVDRFGLVEQQVHRHDLAVLHVGHALPVFVPAVEEVLRRGRLRLAVADRPEDAALARAVGGGQQTVLLTVVEFDFELIPVLRLAVPIRLVEPERVGVQLRVVELQPVAVLARAFDLDPVDNLALLPAEGQLLHVPADAQPEAAVLHKDVLGLGGEALRQEDLAAAPEVDVYDHGLLLGAAEAVEVVVRAGPVDVQLNLVAALGLEDQHVVLKGDDALVDCHAVFDQRLVDPLAVRSAVVRHDADRAVVGIPRIDEADLAVAVLPGVPIQRLRLVKQHPDRADAVLRAEGFVPIIGGIVLRRRLRFLVQRKEDAAAVGVVVRDQLVVPLVVELEVEPVVIRVLVVLMRGRVQVQRVAVALDIALIDAVKAAVRVRFEPAHALVGVPGEGDGLGVRGQAQLESRMVRLRIDVLLGDIVRQTDLAVVAPADVHDDGLFPGAAEAGIVVIRLRPVDFKIHPAAVFGREGQHVVLILYVRIDAGAVFDQHVVVPVAAVVPPGGAHEDAPALAVNVDEADLAALPCLPIQLLRGIEQQTDRLDRAVFIEGGLAVPAAEYVVLDRGGRRPVAERAEDAAPPFVVVRGEGAGKVVVKLKLDLVVMEGIALIVLIAGPEFIVVVPDLVLVELPAVFQTEPGVPDVVRLAPGEGQIARALGDAELGLVVHRHALDVFVRRDRQLRAVPVVDIDKDRLFLGGAEGLEVVLLLRPEDVDIDTEAAARGEGQHVVLIGKAVLRRGAVSDHKFVKPVAVLIVEARDDIDLAVVRLPGIGEDELAGIVVTPPIQRAGRVDQDAHGLQRAVFQEADILAARVVFSGRLRLPAAERDKRAAEPVVVVHAEQVIVFVLVCKIKIQMVVVFGSAVFPGLVQRKHELSVMGMDLLLPIVAVHPRAFERGLGLPGEGQALGVDRQAHLRAALLHERVLVGNARGDIDAAVLVPVKGDDDRLFLSAAEAVELVILARPVDVQLDVRGGLRRKGQNIVCKRKALGDRRAVFDDGAVKPAAVRLFISRDDIEVAVVRIHPRVDVLDAARAVVFLAVERAGLIQQQIHRKLRAVVRVGKAAPGVVAPPAQQQLLAEPLRLLVADGHKHEAVAVVVVQRELGVPVVAEEFHVDVVPVARTAVVVFLSQRDPVLVPLGEPDRLPAVDLDAAHAVAVAPADLAVFGVRGQAGAQTVVAAHFAAVVFVVEPDAAVVVPVDVDKDRIVLRAEEAAELVVLLAPVDADVVIAVVFRREREHAVFVAEEVVVDIAPAVGLLVDPVAVLVLILHEDEQLAVVPAAGIAEADLAGIVEDVPVDPLCLVDQKIDLLRHAVIQTGEYALVPDVVLHGLRGRLVPEGAEHAAPALIVAQADLAVEVVVGELELGIAVVRVRVLRVVFAELDEIAAVGVHDLVMAVLADAADVVAVRPGQREGFRVGRHQHLCSG